MIAEAHHIEIKRSESMQTPLTLLYVPTQERLETALHSRPKSKKPRLRKRDKLLWVRL